MICIKSGLVAPPNRTFCQLPKPKLVGCTALVAVFIFLGPWVQLSLGKEKVCSIDMVLVPLRMHRAVLFVVQMCHLVLPGMKARKQGAIVNIGSGHGSVLPAGPLYAVYAASKVYGLYTVCDEPEPLAFLGPHIHEAATFAWHYCAYVPSW